MSAFRAKTIIINNNEAVAAVGEDFDHQPEQISANTNKTRNVTSPIPKQTKCQIIL